MDLKDLRLTENDFKLLLEGLDAIPEKGCSGLLVASLAGEMMTHGMPEHIQKKVKQEQEARELRHKRSVEAKADDIAILIGKLTMLKRFLQTNGALKSVDDIINPLNK